MERFYAYPLLAKTIEWGRLATFTGILQVSNHALAFICGIVIIRLLPATEYAYYTLANSMLGTLIVVTDSGIAAGITGLGGKVWSDRKQLGSVIVAGLKQRKKFAAICYLVNLPILMYLLLHQGAGWIIAITIVVALLPAFTASISETLLEIPSQLHQDLRALQKNQLEAGVARLLGTLATILVFPFSFVAVLFNGLPRIWANFRLRKLCLQYADLDQPACPSAAGEIAKRIRYTLPGALYYSFSGQITIWLISIFGNTTSIAQLGALGRVGFLLSFIGTVFQMIILPRFARLPESRKVLVSRYFYSLLIALLSGGLMVLVSGTFPKAVLWILGAQYAGLSLELVVSMAAALCSMVGGLSYYLNAHRGWIIHPLVSIPANVLVLIAGILIFDISTVLGVVLLNLLLSFFVLLMNVSFGLIRIKRLL